MKKKRERDYNNRFEDRGRIVGDIQRWSFTKRMVKVLDDEWNEVVAALKCLSRSNYYFTYLSIQNFIVSWTFLLCQYIVVRFRLNNDTWFDNQFIIFLCIFQRITLRILILLVEQQQLPLKRNVAVVIVMIIVFVDDTKNDSKARRQVSWSVAASLRYSISRLSLQYR